MRRGFAILALASLLNASGLAVALAQDARNCDTNAVVYCGTQTKDEFIQKYHNGDGRHTAADIQQAMATGGFAAWAINMAQDGVVTKDGRVLVGTTVVASNAQSFGRVNMAGSTAIGNLFRRPTSVSFMQDRLEAFVLMDKGVFKSAVLKSCGNPVVGTPITVTTTGATPTPPPPPAPTTPAPTPPPVVVTSTPPPAVMPPPPPAPIPATGSEPIAAALGLVLMGGAGIWYRRSQRELQAALRRAGPPAIG